MIGSCRGDLAEVGARISLAVRLTLGAMLVVAAFGGTALSPTVTSGAVPKGHPALGAPVATSSASHHVAPPTPAPAPTPAPTPTPTSAGPATVFWVVAHPDDETISSAGAMYESQKAGNRNVLIVVTDGETSGVGPQLRLSLKQVAAARDKEAIAALALIGIAPVFLHEPDTGGGVQQGFVEQEIVRLASETKGPVVFEGLSPNDAYLNLPHGHPDHYTVARALGWEFNMRVIHNLVFRHLSNFSSGKRYGTCEFLSAAVMKTKQAMRAAYAYVDVSIGRYGIAGKSVGLMWQKTPSEPECHENVELNPGIALGS